MRISVGIPIVKSQFLKEALESWRNQTYRDFEAIIINDASKEECDAIVEPFLSDNRFHYIKRAHSSFPYFVRNWNECLKRATGEWFVLASDDDVYDKTFLEKMLGVVDPRGVDLIHCRTIQLLPDGTLGKVNALFPEYETQMEFVNDIFVHTRGILGQNFMSRTSRLKEIGGFVDVCVAWGSDYLTYALMAKNGVIYCKEPLMLWRFSGKNISSLLSHKMNLLKLRGVLECQSVWRERIFPVLVYNSELERQQYYSFLLELQKQENGSGRDIRALLSPLWKCVIYYVRMLMSKKKSFVWYFKFWLIRFIN